MGSTLILVPVNNPLQIQQDIQTTQNTTVASAGNLTTVPPDIQNVSMNATITSTDNHTTPTPISVQTQTIVQQAPMNTTLTLTEMVVPVSASVPFQRQPDPQNVPIDYIAKRTESVPTPLQVQPYIQNVPARPIGSFISHPAPISYQFQSISTVKQNQFTQLRPQVYQLQPISIIPTTFGSSFNSFPKVEPSYFIQDISQSGVPHVEPSNVSKITFSKMFIFNKSL